MRYLTKVTLIAATMESTVEEKVRSQNQGNSEKTYPIIRTLEGHIQKGNTTEHMQWVKPMAGLRPRKPPNKKS